MSFLNPVDAVLLVPLLPLLGVLGNLLFRPLLGRTGAILLACSAAGASFLASLAAAWGLLRLPAGERWVDWILWKWISAGNLDVSLGLWLDPLSAVMILVVTGVGTVIHVYSAGYMRDDEGLPRYFLYLNLFLLAMLLLVLGDSFLLLFLGWEGVGLASYLLIGFWYHKPSAAEAGKKAFLVNRVGDFAFLLGMLLLFTLTGTLDFAETFARAGESLPAGSGLALLVTLLLFAGATGKSAQLPLHIWLPDAMEGPTPVSALIHAATMVTAGVYLVCRAHPLFELSPVTLAAVAVTGLATALFAATVALVQTDIKRVLAWSTISQLGFMFLAAGSGAYGAAIFHLVTHAFFKALLFLGAGSVIHALEGEQDILRMGGLRRKLPATYWTFLVGTLAIAGIPPLAGFVSKDEILFAAFSLGERGGGSLLWIGGIFTAFLTAFYMTRLLSLVFLGEYRGPAGTAAHIHESPPVMTVPLVILAVLSALGGLLGIPLVKEWNLLHRWLGEVFVEIPLHAAEGAAGAGRGLARLLLETGLMGVSAVVGITGLIVALWVFLRRPEVAENFRRDYGVVHRLFFRAYWVDEAYRVLVTGPLARLSDLLAFKADARVVDGAVDGAAEGMDRLGRLLRRTQTGFVENYALVITVGLTLMLLWALFR